VGVQLLIVLMHRYKLLLCQDQIPNLILVFLQRVDLVVNFKIFIFMRFTSHLIFDLFLNKVMVFFL